jgi:23S rRNA pseudouridine1911/1915/1917 synthase
MFDLFTNDQNETSLLDFLCFCYEGRSKSSVRSLLKHNCVSVEGMEIALPNVILKKGAKVKVLSNKKPLAKNIESVFEDREVMIVNKPPGLLSVAKDKDTQRNLHGVLKIVCSPRSPLVVHRLDKDTSGLILFAKSSLAQKKLKKQLEDRTMSRNYYGIVEGKLDSKSGTWKSYLYEDERQSVHVTADPEKGKLATTHYEVLRSKGKFSLVKFSLESGRKHQIRVHCAQAGVPLSGDKKYGAVTNSFSRLCLHAFRLRFNHPITEKSTHFEIPMPKAFYTYFYPPKERGFCEVS